MLFFSTSGRLFLIVTLKLLWKKGELKWIIPERNATVQMQKTVAARDDSEDVNRCAVGRFAVVGLDPDSLDIVENRSKRCHVVTAMCLTDVAKQTASGT